MASVFQAYPAQHQAPIVCPNLYKNSVSALKFPYASRQRVDRKDGRRRRGKVDGKPSRKKIDESGIMGWTVTWRCVSKMAREGKKCPGTGLEGP